MARTKGKEVIAGALEIRVLSRPIPSCWHISTDVEFVQSHKKVGTADDSRAWRCQGHHRLAQLRRQFERPKRMMETDEGKHRHVPSEVVFRDRLRAFVGTVPAGSMAKRLNIKYRRFHRWLNDGIKWPNHHSFEDVRRLAEAMGLEDWRDLWRDTSADEEECRALRQKVDVLLEDRSCRGMLKKAIEYISKERERLASEPSEDSENESH